MFGIVIKLDQIYYLIQDLCHRFDKLIKVNLKQYILRYIYIYIYIYISNKTILL
jgi:hypothetical protein